MSDDRSADFRAKAAECLMLAARSTDPVTRAAMINQAERWLTLADEPQGVVPSDDALKDAAGRGPGKR